LGEIDLREEDLRGWERTECVTRRYIRGGLDFKFVTIVTANKKKVHTYCIRAKMRLYVCGVSVLQHITWARSIGVIMRY
jgi:hypothetical protein